MTAPRHYWQHRPSSDRLGNAPYVHGPLQPMPEPRRSLVQRIFGRGCGS